MKFIINYITNSVKLDILKLKNVTDIREQLELIEKHYGVKIKEEDIPLDDQKTWDLISAGNTLGVFQFASNVAIPILRKMKPQNMEELAAANSLIRPGTSGLDEYCAAKNDPSKIKIFGDERIDRHLNKTYGAIVFQEQIMFLISELMGITFGQADLYRRALEKPHKDKKGYVKNFNENVVEIAKKRGFDPKVTEAVRQAIIDNSGYAFNKSHAVAYSIISYWTAWIKVNYPLVFFCNMFNGDLGQLAEFMQAAENLGITIKPPHVSHSKYEAIIEDKDKKVIRIGLNAVKGVGPAAVSSIISHQPYNSVNEFFELNNLRSVNKKVIEALINIGAFNNVGIHIEEEDIPQDFIEKFKIKYKNGLKYVCFNRTQMSIWYKKYNEIMSTKSINKYAVPVSMIKGKYMERYLLATEKDNTIIIPEDKLEIFDLKVSDVEAYKNNRRKASAFLSLEDESEKIKKASNFRKPIILAYEELSFAEENNLEIYVKEIEDLGFSFVQHPLQHCADSIKKFNDIEDGDELITGGIIIEMIERMSKNNKKFYWVNIKTPHEILRITLWDNQFRQFHNDIKLFNVIKVKGIKGYGGISCNMLKSIKGQ